jgi:hypothetical protein
VQNPERLTEEYEAVVGDNAAGEVEIEMASFRERETVKMI